MHRASAKTMGPAIVGTAWVRGCASLSRGLCKQGRPFALPPGTFQSTRETQGHRCLLSFAKLVAAGGARQTTVQESSGLQHMSQRLPGAGYNADEVPALPELNLEIETR